MTHALHTADRPVLGVLLMLGFCVLAPFGDALAKLLGETVPLAQLVLIRFGMQVVLLVPFCIATGRSFVMPARILRLVALRSVFHFIGLSAMFLSLQYLPLADAVAIAFVMPFIMLLLGSYVLGEEVGTRRLVACTIGFTGTLMVIQPSFAAVGYPALLPLVVALAFSLFMLVTRQVAKAVDPIAMQGVSGAMSCAPVLIAMVLWPSEPGGALDWRPPTETTTLALLILTGVLGTFAHLLMTWSLRYAPSATLAPMQYLEIPVATLLGFAMFGDWPNGLAQLGIAVTIGAGLYIIFREQRLARIAPPAA